MSEAVPVPAEGTPVAAGGGPLPAEAPPVPPGPRRRNLLAVLILLAATLSLYFFWLIYRWCTEVNGLLGRRKYRPLVLLLVSLLTLGGAGLVVQCFLALDLERLGRERGTARRLPGLTAILAALGLANLVLNAPPVLEALRLAPPLVHRLAERYWLLTLLSASAGAASVLLLQRELNLHADRRPASRTVD
jgi:hypothetical protein